MFNDDENRKQQHLICLFESRLFQGLTPEEIKIVYYQGNIVRYDEGDIVIREGHSNSSLYVIMNGELMVYLPRTHTRHARIKLATLGSGDCIGEYSFIDNNPTSATVSPVKPTELFKISRERFEALLEKHNHIGQAIYKNLLLMMVKRLRETNVQIDFFTFTDTEGEEDV